MEIKILEEKKDRAVFELKGLGHTLSNALRDELWNDKAVKVAAYNISHPLVKISKFIIETDGKEKPLDALKSAITRLKRRNTALKKKVLKVLK